MPGLLPCVWAFPQLMASPSPLNPLHIHGLGVASDEPPRCHGFYHIQTEDGGPGFQRALMLKKPYSLALGWDLKLCILEGAERGVRQVRVDTFYFSVISCVFNVR